MAGIPEIRPGQSVELLQELHILTRDVLLGHVQRGGTPTAYDRVLSTRYGVAAIDAVHMGAWGHMVALRGNDVLPVPLSETVGKTREVDMHLYHEVAEVFFG